MSILLQSNQLKENFCQFFAGTDPLPDTEKLLTAYSAFFDVIQHGLNGRLTISEIQSVSDLNIAFVVHHLKLAQARAEIDLRLAKGVIDWNLDHDTILSETRVCTYVLRAYVDLVFEDAPLSKILADLDEALAIAYCEQTDFFMVAAVYKLRSRVLEKMGDDYSAEAKESAREAIVFSAWDADYKKVIRRNDSGVKKVLRTLIGLP